MNELLIKRIERRLANLSDEHGYRVLDYVEFLESKYGTRDRGNTVFEKIADGVEDTLRATRVPKAAIRGTMGAMDTASQIMDRLAQAGRTAVEELGKTLGPLESPGADAVSGESAGADAAQPAAESEHAEPESSGAEEADSDEEKPTGAA